MQKRFSFKTFLTTLIGTSIASSLIASPILARASNLAEQSVSTSSEVSALANSKEIQASMPLVYAQINNSTNTEPVNDLNRVLGITALGAGTAGLVWYLTHSHKPSLVNSIPQNNVALLDQVNPRLRQKLLRLVHNRQTANRLLAGTMMSHSGRSPDWLAEKVIYDLERDRH